MDSRRCDRRLIGNDFLDDIYGRFKCTDPTMTRKKKAVGLVAKVSEIT